MILSTSTHRRVSEMVLSPPNSAYGAYRLQVSDDVTITMHPAELDRLIELMERVRDEAAAR